MTTPDIERNPYIAAMHAIEKAVAAERERCAGLCERLAEMADPADDAARALEQASAAIRKGEGR